MSEFIGNCTSTLFSGLLTARSASEQRLSQERTLGDRQEGLGIGLKIPQLSDTCRLRGFDVLFIFRDDTVVGMRQVPQVA